MAQRLPKLGVQLVGRKFIRFIVADDQERYWTGEGWTPVRSKALLYVHLELVQADLRKLKRNRRRSS